MRTFAAPLLAFLFTSAWAQTPSAPAPAANPAAMSTYHNDDLRLTYTYPSSYTDASAMVGPAFQSSLNGDPAAAAAAHCISLPFSRMQNGTGQMGILLLIRANAACLKKKFNAKSVAEMAQGEAQGLAASGAKTSFRPPVSFDVANRPAALLQGSFMLPTGQAMQAMVVCVLDQPDIACWQFLANTAASLKTMSTFPVAFDPNAPATPLVPATVLMRP